MRGIKSKNHNVTTYEKNKMSLSAFDDTQYILDDGINTLPYGQIYQKMNKIVLTMIEKKINAHVFFFVKDIKNKKFQSITFLLKKL